MTKWAIGTAIALCCAFSANAATILFGSYKNPKDEQARTFYKLHLDGLTEGFITFNVALRQYGRPPLFCLPPKMALTIAQAEDIMFREAKTVRDPDRTPIAIVLLEGLKETFPCDTEEK
jgi:hypothetical protein